MSNIIFKFTSFAAVFLGCISYIEAQLDSYYNLTVTDIKEKCKNNVVDLNELNVIHNDIENFFFDENTNELSIEDAFETNDNCMDSINITSILQSELKIIKKCLKGNISILDEDIEILIRQSIKKLCAFTRLSLFQRSLSTCIDWDRKIECVNNVLKSGNISPEELENSGEFANLGLKYSPKGRKIWDDLLDCSSYAIQMCEDEQKNTFLELTSRMKDLLKVRN
ncbi:uncharacterized protein LOC127279138 [Leptopilina boulardi]|uniref:uncharacterized protein LOC127279138 n=1 Tax=Leptopilina boulardi TaxID=63433 RepID=UPI0021F5A420|nr:uncharacterized protein LOC127279138 [Leptopilina boulardi]